MILAMTLSTKRNDIEPVLRGVPAPVMILLCLSTALLALEIGGRGKLASVNGGIERTSGFYLVWVLQTAFTIGPAAFFGLAVFAASPAIDFFARLRLPICFQGGINAAFTPTVQPIGIAAAFVKLRQWFDLLAFRATLCLNCVRHNRFLVKRLCSEPLAGTYPQMARFIVADRATLSIVA
jgi:hypothetical protein